MSPRVVVDPDICVGAGLCALRLPEVFDQDEDDGTVVLLADPAPEQAALVREAVEQCPSGAIALARTSV